MRRHHPAGRATLAVAALFLAGCGSVRHAAHYDTDFAAAKDMQIEVDSVVNVTGTSYEEDIVPLFRNALSKELSDANLLWSATGTTPHMVLSTKIVEYEPGYSLKRWLIPGWGTALCTVHCELKHSDMRTLLGSIDTRRTISIGQFAGGRRVVENTAADVAGAIMQKIQEK